MQKVVADLVKRACKHDHSKLLPPELETFDRCTARLAGLSYNSPEYKACLAEMKPALDHHYRRNDHHPEHFGGGIGAMNLLQLLELVCDWKAASERHADGSIFRSIEQNQQRFGYSDELKKILTATAVFLHDHPTTPV